MNHNTSVLQMRHKQVIQFPKADSKLAWYKQEHSAALLAPTFHVGLYFLSDTV